MLDWPCWYTMFFSPPFNPSKSHPIRSTIPLNHQKEKKKHKTPIKIPIPPPFTITINEQSPLFSHPITTSSIKHQSMVTELQLQTSPRFLRVESSSAPRRPVPRQLPRASPGGKIQQAKHQRIGIYMNLMVLSWELL